MLDFIKAYGVAENTVVTLVAINSARSGCNLCFKFRFGHFNPQLVRNSCDRQGLNIGSHTTIRGTFLSAATCTFFLFSWIRWMRHICLCRCPCSFGYSFRPVPFGRSCPLGLLLTLISVPRAWQKGKQSWQFKLKLFAASQQQAVKPKNEQRIKPVPGKIGAKNKMKGSKNRRAKN